jgi:hypothetical protein
VLVIKPQYAELIDQSQFSYEIKLSALHMELMKILIQATSPNTHTDTSAQLTEEVEGDAGSSVIIEQKQSSYIALASISTTNRAQEDEQVHEEEILSSEQQPLLSPSVVIDKLAFLEEPSTLIQGEDPRPAQGSKDINATRKKKKRRVSSPVASNAPVDEIDSIFQGL